MSSKEPLVTLSVKLIREGRSVEDALRGKAFSEIVCAEPEGARLFVSSSTRTPTWQGYVNRIARDPLSMTNRSSSVLLFLNIYLEGDKTRIAALTFGGGHHALDPDFIERDFGLRVVLNSVPRGEISSIDAATPDAVTFQRRIQASRNSDISAFGMDVERDLLRVAAGTPSDKSFASFVAGRDSLSIQCRVAPKDLPKKIEKCIELSKASHYQADFEWVDNVRRVKEKDKIAFLDQLAFDEIGSMRSGHPSDMHAAPPEIHDYTEGRLIAYYGPGLNARKNWYRRLDLVDYISDLVAAQFSGGLDAFKAHEVHVHKDEDGSPNSRWKLYECLVWETTLDGDAYVLFGGGWYLINENFWQTVERDLKRILTTPAFIASTYARNEKEIIREIEALPTYINLDQTKLSPGGIKAANIEFSDFLSHTRQIIHLKDGHSSSAISHLWAQGLVCGDAFASDLDFRKRLRAATRKREKALGRVGFVDLLPLMKGRVDTTRYKIVYGVMRRRHARSGRLDIPFFSKVSLRPTVKQLEKLGYKVELHIIEKVQPTEPAAN